ncbi:hypothetical protein MLD38_033151 [Melastoma candidum]|uniref:Uncharacterized protein n=1 Tax=Melastoma candidum TaxID=119954 RepID=A0ACB9M6E0_9MYRT|nr:hypothetical protein MLD38_033151 [Melastoma candidum]
MNKTSRFMNLSPRDWELVKAGLESQVNKLSGQFQAPNEPRRTTNPENHSKPEPVEKENQSLKFRILSVVEELEIRVLERELSIQEAKSSSKQYLQSMKKMARLGSECRRLRAVSTEKSPCEYDGQKLVGSSGEVDMMDDFLEMEGFAGMELYSQQKICSTADNAIKDFTCLRDVALVLIV